MIRLAEECRPSRRTLTARATPRNLWPAAVATICRLHPPQHGGVEPGRPRAMDDRTFGGQGARRCRRPIKAGLKAHRATPVTAGRPKPHWLRSGGAEPIWLAAGRFCRAAVWAKGEFLPSRWRALAMEFCLCGRKSIHLPSKFCETAHIAGGKRVTTTRQICPGRTPC